MFTQFSQPQRSWQSHQGEGFGMCVEGDGFALRRDDSSYELPMTALCVEGVGIV